MTREYGSLYIVVVDPFQTSCTATSLYGLAHMIKQHYVRANRLANRTFPVCPESVEASKISEVERLHEPYTITKI